MQTRTNISKYYDLDSQGTIRNPGRFEGEHFSTVLAWDIVMDGGADESIEWADGTTLDIIHLDDTLRAEWECTEKYFTIEQTDQGFVYGEEIDEKEYQDIISAADRESERMSDSDE